MRPYETRSTRDRYITHSLKIWVSTKSSISRMCLFFFVNIYQVPGTPIVVVTYTYSSFQPAAPWLTKKVRRSCGGAAVHHRGSQTRRFQDFASCIGPWIRHAFLVVLHGSHSVPKYNKHLCITFNPNDPYLWDTVVIGYSCSRGTMWKPATVKILTTDLLILNWALLSWHL